MAANFYLQHMPLLIMFVVFISIFHSHTSAAARFDSEELQGGDLLQDTCNHTLFYDICISSLESDSRSSEANTDLKRLLRISIDIAKTNASNILVYTQGWITNNTSTNDTKVNLTRSMRTCEEYINGSISSLQHAIQDVDTEDYDGVNMYLNEAIIGPDFCDIAIHDSGYVMVEDDVLYDNDEDDEDDDGVSTFTIDPTLSNMNLMMSNLLQISIDVLCYLSPNTTGCS